MAAPELSPEQQTKLISLRESVASKLQASSELRVWCTDSCLQRYLRARDWDLNKATKQILKSIEWRESYKPDSIRWEDIQEESKTGKTYLGQHRDLDGRPVIIMRPRNENSKNVERQLKFLVYNLELASRRADEAGVGKMTWLIDFEGYSYRNAPPIKLSLHALHLLQSHYPERLGLAVCYHPPMLFSLTWKATSPFIDPVTYRKIHFVDKDDKGRAFMSERFGDQHLEECLGGQNSFVFDYDSHGHQMREEDAKLVQSIQHAAAS